MILHIIRNLKLVRNQQNTWKHHKTRLIETNTKLTTLLLKFHGQNKGGVDPSYTCIKYIMTSS